MATETSAGRLLEQSRSRPQAPAYFVKTQGQWRPTTWSEYARQVMVVSRALVALGLKPGEATANLGFNRPEWTTFDLATSLAGGIPVGIYTTSSAPEVSFILHHARARIALVEDLSQWRKLNEERERLPLLEKVVLMKGAELPDDLEAGEITPISWETLLEAGREIPQEVVLERLSRLKSEDVATLIYTSGTTGPPKAVMLTHQNLTWTAKTALTDLLSITADDSLLSYLPLSHIAEKMFTIHGSVAAGYAIYFAQAPTSIADDLREVQPTLIFGVPRVWERLYSAVKSRLSTTTGAKARLLGGAMAVTRRAVAASCRGEKPPLLTALGYRLAQRLILQRIKPLLGLGRARICASGAAPISKEILVFFSGLDILIHEVYGQSEGCGPTTFNSPGATRLGTVGPAVPGVDVRIAEDGEVLVRGPNVFPGYFEDPGATAETLVEGWLHSGDLGALSEDGYLTITGRKKELLITSGGKNISPNNIETALKDQELISEAVVIGDGRRYLTALLVVQPEAVRQRFGEIEDLRQRPDLREAFQEAVDTVNARLARVQTVRKFQLLDEPFSVETGELTATLKLKRRVVEEKFSDLIEAMYRED
ncbi:MAG: long-chain fatty acid--CoA ligase [Deltaproteobacteria bacterium]|nr:long-chain fatty acid--CoA ligase [Deltaproteobacteria bacterium]